VTIYLDIQAKKGLFKARALHKGSLTVPDRLEQESTSFHEKVRQGYLAVAREFPDRIKIVKTRSTKAETQSAIRK